MAATATGSDTGETVSLSGAQFRRDPAFGEAGTFNITCEIHPDMQMTVTVEG